MTQQHERLERYARVAASVLQAHLSWAAERWPDVGRALEPHLDAPTLSIVRTPPQGERDSILFSDLVRIDRAIEETGDRSGRIRIARYQEYSPVYCLGGRGYYEEALRMMRVPGPAVVREVACQCSGAEACVFELSW